MNLFGLLFLILTTPIFGFTFRLSTPELVGIIFLGIFPTAIAFLVWNKALYLTKTYICANIALLTPLISLILIMIILNEKIHYAQIIGLVMIIGSVFLNLQHKEKKLENK